MRRLFLDLRARWLGALGSSELSAGNYPRAASLLSDAGTLAERADGPNSVLVMSLLNTLGMTRKYQGRFADGRRAYRRALAIARSRFGRDHESLAALYHNLGGIEHARGRFPRARVFAEHGLALRQQALGPDHVKVARDQAALAAILDGLGLHERAEVFHRRALAIFEHRMRGQHPDIANTLANLAACLHQSGRTAEAEPIAVRAVAMSRKTLGRSHPETAWANANLGVIRNSLALMLCLGLGAVTTVSGQVAPPTLTIARASGPITLDGGLDDTGWQGATPITTWFETNVGDNVEPHVRNVAYLAYDSRYLYAAFLFEDPQPDAIRAPLGDHDAMPPSTDYAGVIVNSLNDGKTAQMFMANPRGAQYDALNSDASGEDSSPDFLWDAAGRITPNGWTLELRIPYASLRYANQADPTWQIMLHRNYPRDRRYQFFTARIPRDANCFVCSSTQLVGLADLPRGSHLVVAPYVTAQGAQVPQGDPGSPLEARATETDGGLDLKWSPSTSGAIDLTINPDFSQVESDAAQITANERSALFFPEKRPFFLEGVDLLATPLPVVYTRSITSPRAGLRATGKRGGTAFTALVTHDRGGGLVILPGPQGSGFALQDFPSDVGILRVRHDLGRSFVSLLATGRVLDQGGSNFVVGPDAQWRPSDSDALAAQVLWSQSRTPELPELAAEWDGRVMNDRALFLEWSHTTERVDWVLETLDVGPDFRADNGFVPQVGYREAYLDAGYTLRPDQAFASRIRLFTEDYYDVEPDGRPLNQHLSLGSEMDGLWNSFTRVELNLENVRVGEAWLQRFRPRVLFQASPGRILNQLSLDTRFGQEIDFDNAREGDGINVVASVTVRPNAHLEVQGNGDLRTLNAALPGGARARVFTAGIGRVRATWSFTARAFVRLVGQYVETRRDPTTYTFEVPSREAEFTGSALAAYKVNWQTVFYLGYGNAATWAVSRADWAPGTRELFAKVSYAWQE